MNIAHTCNMNCTYCFASGGQYGNAESLMSKDVAQRSLDLLAASPFQGRKTIALFGGEPLCNPDTLEFILRYGRATIGDEKKLGFMISTNGTMLTEQLTRLLSEHRVTIQISVDGARELQNRLRPLRGKNVDSFSQITANLDVALMIDRFIHGRATVTNLCPDALDLAAQLFSLGFRSISLQPVQGCDALELDDQQMSQLAAGYVTLARRGMRAKVSWLNSYVNRIRKRVRTETFCGAGVRGLTVTPDGTFYVCHRFVPYSEFRVGDVWAGVDDQALRGVFAGKHGVESSLVCRSCLFRHLCGGGCMAENYEENGDIRDPWPRRCILTKAVCCAAVDAFIDEEYRVADRQEVEVSG